MDLGVITSGLQGFIAREELFLEASRLGHRAVQERGRDSSDRRIQGIDKENAPLPEQVSQQIFERRP